MSLNASTNNIDDIINRILLGFQIQLTAGEQNQAHIFVVIIAVNCWTRKPKRFILYLKTVCFSNTQDAKITTGIKNILMQRKIKTKQNKNILIVGIWS